MKTSLEWPEDEDERETLPVREKDTPRQPDTHVNKIFLTTRILRGHLSVLAYHNWRTAEVPKFEKILTALEQFFVKNQITLGERLSFQRSNQERNMGQRRTARRKRVGSQYRKFYKKRHENVESGVRMRYLRGRKGRMEANSSRGKKSAESRGSCSEDLGSRGRGQMLTETRESCSSPENLETNERNNGQGSQIRSLSLQLIQSTKVTQKMIKSCIRNSQ